MNEKMARWCAKGRVRLIKAMERFAEEEKGVETWVAIVVVIVVVIVIATLFQKKLKASVEAIFKNLDDFIKNSDAPKE